MQLATTCATLGATSCAILLLAACSSEPTFDERFEEAQEDIEERTQALEADLEGEPEHASTNSPTQ